LSTGEHPSTDFDWHFQHKNSDIAPLKTMLQFTKLLKTLLVGNTQNKIITINNSSDDRKEGMVDITEQYFFTASVGIRKTECEDVIFCLAKLQQFC